MRLVAVALVAITLTACSSDSDPADKPSESLTPPTVTVTESSSTPPPAPTRLPTPTITGTVAQGLDVPWGIAFLPGGGALVAERATAKLKHITKAGKVSDVGTVPDVVPAGEGGLLGIAVAKDYARNPYVYAMFTAASDNRVVRFKLTEFGLGPVQVLLHGIQKNVIHNGGRLAFGPDGKLYIGAGDAGNTANAQDKSTINGKILRINPDGTIPADNPFPNSPVWSYGHRNVQGLAFDNRGRLWASEFGQDTYDELNLIKKGGNYGWPEVEGKANDSRYIDPVAQWPTDDASPSGIAYADGAIWMAALKGERLWRIPTDGSGAPKAFFTGTYGRLRTVVAAPDGDLWLSTSNKDGRGDPKPGDDRILRVTLR